MPGFARLVLDKMKEQGDYREFLRYVIDSDSFKLVTKGAQGSILEDAICCLLTRKPPIKFVFTDLRGAKQALSTIDVRGDRFLLRFTGVPQRCDLAKWDVSHWLIRIPPAGYTGIDFVLARKRKTFLEIFFI
jgi:hypothetical protein